MGVKRYGQRRSGRPRKGWLGEIEDIGRERRKPYDILNSREIGRVGRNR